MGQMNWDPETHPQVIKTRELLTKLQQLIDSGDLDPKIQKGVVLYFRVSRDAVNNWVGIVRELRDLDEKCKKGEIPEKTKIEMAQTAIEESKKRLCRIMSRFSMITRNYPELFRDGGIEPPDPADWWKQ